MHIPRKMLYCTHQPEQQAKSSTKLEATTNGSSAESIPPSARICKVGKIVYQVHVDLLLVIWVVLMSFLVYG
jgi:lipopolysaccharide/colanic/teichoic acid biosynthesis glycosyltransferase